MDSLLPFASLDESGMTSELSFPAKDRVANPRRLPLPAAHQLEAGIGKAQFLGVTYRQDRAGTRPWVARYLDCTIGTYKTALDAAVARWICSTYDRDVIEEEGAWYGQAYQGKQERSLVITRFTAASEIDVIRQIDELLNGNIEPAQIANNRSSATEPVALLLPANPRREAALPTELPRTSGRGQYRGVIESKGRFVARWNNTLHLCTYDTAIEAGLAVYIADHYDRDIEADGHHGFTGRAYRRTPDGKPSVQHFRADTEAELMRLIDEYHGVVGRAENEDSSSANVVQLDQAIRRFWDELYLKHSKRDGHAVCEELYLMWQLFLARHGLPHLVEVKEKEWCRAMEKTLSLRRFNLPYDANMQVLSIPPECRLPVKQRKGVAVWKPQWDMIMTATCASEVCVAAWKRRRTASKRRNVIIRHAVIEAEIEERKLLKQRLPEWVDDWVRPRLLTMDEKLAALKLELAEVDFKTLQHWLSLEPDNSLFSDEMEKRFASADGM